MTQMDTAHDQVPSICVRQGPPDLFGRKAHTGAINFVKATTMSKSTVCDPRRKGESGPECIETILQNIEVDGAQVHRAEIVKCMKNRVKLKIFIGSPDTSKSDSLS